MLRNESRRRRIVTNIRKGDEVLVVVMRMIVVGVVVRLMMRSTRSTSPGDRRIAASPMSNRFWRRSSDVG